VQAADLRAVNGEWYAQTSPCDVVCGACQEVPEVDRTSEYFIARCVEQSCQLVDLRDDYADCTSDDDCFLRDGSSCCEECDGSDYIAVSSLAFASELACPENICPACASPAPEGLSAQCNTETHRCDKVQD